jgi:outer membrane protein assembly factor BamB
MIGWAVLGGLQDTIIDSGLSLATNIITWVGMPLKWLWRQTFGMVLGLIAGTYAVVKFMWWIIGMTVVAVGDFFGAVFVDAPDYADVYATNLETGTMDWQYCVDFCNWFVGLDVLFAGVVWLLSFKVAGMVYRFVKSWIPTVS